MIKPIIFSNNFNLKDMQVLHSFHAGCKSVMLPVEKIKLFEPQADGNNFVAWGVLRGQQEVLRRAKNFWYIDNGYYLRSHVLDASCLGFYRVQFNRMYGKPIGNKPWDRFWKFAEMSKLPRADRAPKQFVGLKDWRSLRKDFIYLAPPSKYMAPVINRQTWTEDTIEELKKYTDRPIVVGSKDKKLDFEDDCPWCVVTCISNLQVECMMQGCPVITTDFTNIGSLADIENPPMGVRQILADLAYQQWTLKQFRSGQAWEELNELYPTIKQNND